MSKYTKMLGRSLIAALGPFGGLFCHFILHQHALWGVTIGVFLSALINQFLNAKFSSSGVASIAGAESVGSGSSVGTSGSGSSSGGGSSGGGSSDDGSDTGNSFGG